MARLGHGRKRVPVKMTRTPRWKAEGLYVYPSSKKYPIGDLYHARMALGGIYASSGYTTKAQRRKILTAVARAYPDYNWASYWNKHIMGNKKARSHSKDGAELHPLYNWDKSVAPASRKVAANPWRKTMSRRRNYGSIRILENPYGIKLGKGKAVRTASGKRTHIKGSGDETLCGSEIGKDSDAKVITCYRCIKLVNMNGLNTRERDLRFGKRKKHYMIPGGREGQFVGSVDMGASLSDAEFEALIGDENYPTQSLGMIEHIREEQTGSKRRRAARKGALARRRKKEAKKRVSNPRSYKMGYAKGKKDYRASSPSPASQIRQRSMDYQVGYLEGYAHSAAKSNPKRRKNTRRRKSR